MYKMIICYCMECKLPKRIFIKLVCIGFEYLISDFMIKCLWFTNREILCI